MEENLSEETKDNYEISYYGDIEKMYLQEISKYRLLTATEEKKFLKIIEKYRHIIKKYDLNYESLSKVINNLPEFANEEVELSKENIDNYIDLINNKVTSLSEKDKKNLIKKIKICHIYHKSYNIMVNHNLRLVVSVAKKYFDKGLPFLDLIQAGNIGLMHSIDKFDSSHETKFSTYAVYWIRQSIVRELVCKVPTIRIPDHIAEELATYNRAISNLEIRDIPLTIDNIYEEMLSLFANTKIKSNDPKEIAEYKKELSTKFTKEKVADLQKITKMNKTISLDKKIPSSDRDENITMLDFISDEDLVSDEEDDMSKLESIIDNTNILIDAMKKVNISADFKMITCLRYGLDINKYLTAEEITNIISKYKNITAKKLLEITNYKGETLLKEMCKAFNCSRDRINRIVNRTLKSLRCQINQNNSIFNSDHKKYSKSI